MYIIEIYIETLYKKFYICRKEFVQVFIYIYVKLNIIIYVYFLRDSLWGISFLECICYHRVIIIHIQCFIYIKLYNQLSNAWHWLLACVFFEAISCPSLYRAMSRFRYLFVFEHMHAKASAKEQSKQIRDSHETSDKRFLSWRDAFELVLNWKFTRPPLATLCKRVFLMPMTVPAEMASFMGIIIF